MALVLNGAASGATGSHVAAGVTEVIASGDFDGSKVEVNLSAEATSQAPAFSFQTPGAISLNTASGTTILLRVVGGGASTSVDVTCNP